MRRSYAGDPGLVSTVFSLLESVFPGIESVADRARALGAPWEGVSIPFLAFEGGRAVSHVGLIPLTLVLMGNRTRVGTVHAVATHPDHRNRGHYRQAMQELLAYAAGRFETLILTTEHPEYFTPFGFRHVEESVFVAGPAGGAAGAGHRPGVRRLDVGDPRDVARLDRLLSARTPVSHVVGVVEERAIFCFNEGGRPLHYLEDLDVVLCLERDGATLRLFDLVGAEIPSLEVVLERLPWPAGEVLINFSPDRLDAVAEARPRLFDHDGPSYLMVRGPFAAEGRPFTLPRPART